MHTTETMLRALATSKQPPKCANTPLAFMLDKRSRSTRNLLAQMVSLFAHQPQAAVNRSLTGAQPLWLAATLKFSAAVSKPAPFADTGPATRLFRCLQRRQRWRYGARQRQRRCARSDERVVCANLVRTVAPRNWLRSATHWSSRRTAAAARRQCGTLSETAIG